MNIEVGPQDLDPVLRRSQALGEFLFREYTVYEHGIAISDVYERTGVTRADASKTLSKNVTYRPSGANSSTYIKSSVSATFYYNKTDNTAYCRNEDGSITENTTSFKTSDESLTTDQGGGVLGSKRWSEVKFTYKWTNNLNNKMNGGTAKIRVNSAGTVS